MTANQDGPRIEKRLRLSAGRVFGSDARRNFRVRMGSWNEHRRAAVAGGSAGRSAMGVAGAIVVAALMGWWAVTATNAVGEILSAAACVACIAFAALCFRNVVRFRRGDPLPRG